MESQLGLAMILSQDIARAKAFYTEMLGLAVVPRLSSPDGDFLFLTSKSASSTTNVALQDATKQSYGVPAEHGGIALGFEVADADAVYQAWQGKDVEILSPVIDIGAGHMFTVKDPDGNFIQIYHVYPGVKEMQHQAD